MPSTSGAIAGNREQDHSDIDPTPGDTELRGRASRLESLYARGIITRLELIYQILDLADLPGFLDYLAGHPADILEEVRRIASEPPSHPEDCINGVGHSDPMTGDEFERMQLRQRVHSFWHRRSLFRLTHPDPPLPAFEPVRRIGSVDDSILVEGSVALFGLDHHFLIRHHPIRCIPPSGGVIVTAAVQTRFVRLAGDETGDAMRRRFGRVAVLLEADVRSPANVPPGTEVWVDRSAATEIPPLLGRELL